MWIVVASKSTTGLSFEDLACAWSVLHILQNYSLSCTQMDWPCVICWMYPVFNDSVGGMLFTSVYRTLSHYIAKIWKGIWKSFAALLVDLPRFRTALTSRSSASRHVLLLSDLFLQVRIIKLLKMEIERSDW